MMKLVEWLKNDGFQHHQRNFASGMTQKPSPKKKGQNKCKYVKPTNDNKDKLPIKEPLKKRAKDDWSKTKCLNYNQLGHLTKD